MLKSHVLKLLALERTYYSVLQTESVGIFLVVPHVQMIFQKHVISVRILCDQNYRRLPSWAAAHCLSHIQKVIGQLLGHSNASGHPGDFFPLLHSQSDGFTFLLSPPSLNLACCTSRPHTYIPGRNKSEGWRVTSFLLVSLRFFIPEGTPPQRLLPPSHWPELYLITATGCKGHWEIGDFFFSWAHYHPT